MSPETQSDAQDNQGNLIFQEALNPNPDPIERRTRPTGRRWFGRERRSGLKAFVGVEVTPDGITIAVVRQSPAESQPSVIVDTVEFDPDSGPQNGNWEAHELSQAISVLVDRHKLQGYPAAVALGGEPCVTRSWFGENDAVDDNIRELTERTHRYLALGHGDKICCYSETPIDAKRKRAWVTIAHRGFVEAVSQAVKASGLRLTHIHHSLPQLCRAVGKVGADAEHPLLLVTKSRGRPELCISFRGQLILDYRPPRRLQQEMANADALEAIRLHIKCLRRYAQAQLPREHSSLDRVCILGQTDLSQGVDRELSQQYELESVPNPILATEQQFQAQDGVPPSAAALVTISMALEGLNEVEYAGGNLVDSLNNRAQISWKEVVKCSWPIAATLLLAAGLHAYAMVENGKLETLAAELEELDGQSLELKVVQADFERATEHLQHTQALQTQLQPSGWAELVRILGRALPKNTWAQRLSVQSDGSWQLQGACFTDQAIYAYIERLNESNVFEGVSLEGVKSIQLTTGPGVEFTIGGKLRIPLTGLNTEDAAQSVAIASSGIQ
ncbi:MAG: hypothetical protein D6753_06935 [Planctomycetota bacterium]|nr:MAG: hypothetical protein D6753_06935 [Planctomycetota bacterium]